MNLSDHDILELNELCNAVVDGTITEKQKAELSQWLITSEDARQFYVRITGLSASLFSYAAEMQTGAADGRHRSGKLWKWASGFLSIAALIAIALWIDRTKPTPPSSVAVGSTSANSVTTAPAVPTTPTENNEEFVAWFSGSKD